MSDPQTEPGNEPKDSAASEDSPHPGPVFAVASQPSYARVLLLGPDGLRSGWGFAFYALAFLLLQRLVNSGVAEWVRWSPHISPRIAEALFEFAGLVAAVIPAILLGRIENRPWRVYGLPLSKALGRLFWIGALWGFAGITLLIVSLYGFRDFDFGHLAMHGTRLAKFALYWSLMFLLVGLFEEFLLRGYTQFTLGRGIGFWPAAVTLSISFGLVHLANEGEHWPGLLAAACIGLFFCLTLRRTGNLWFAVGFHAAWDWGETFFYSVPDSGMVAPGHLLNSSLHGPAWLTGGSVGPEGSAFCFVVIALLWVAFDRMYPRAVKG